jgi:tRNA (adenine37-N6)-methyltransferase
MVLKQIGTIHTSFRKADGTPVQPVMAAGTDGVVEVFPEYLGALADLAGFERVWLVYWFHRATDAKLRVRPFLDDAERGLFATRAPCRPNPIGISSVRLVAVESTGLRVAEVDVLDGTPLLDIKPYVPRFDSFPEARAGWLDRVEVQRREGVRADSRFEKLGGKP